MYFFQCTNDRNLKKLHYLASLKGFDIIDLNNQEYPLTIDYCHRKVYEKFEVFYDKVQPGKRFVNTINRLYPSLDVENLFKKEFMLYLGDHFHKEMMISHSLLKNYGDKIYYSGFDYSTYGSETLLPNNIETNNSKIFFWFLSLKERVKEYLLLFFPFYIIFKIFGGVTLQKGKRIIQVGININLLGMFDKNYHYYYYLIDPMYGIKKSDYVFIDERNDGKAESLDDNYVNIFQRRALSLQFIIDFFTRYVPTWILCSLLCLVQEPILIRSTRKALSDYVKWHSFFDNYSIGKYINILMPDTVTKTGIFHQHGTKTYLIYPDNYADDYHSGYDEKSPAHPYFAYMMYDYAIVYGDKIKRNLLKNRNMINSYLNNGVIHSQRICEIRTGACEKKISVSALFGSKPRKIIAIFDIAFVNWGHMHLDDAIRFAESILKLLDDNPDIAVIFKEKKDISQNSDLFDVYKKIGEHPRGAYIRKTDNTNIYSYDVIAVSDMVISACFTSTHAEALGSKTRSIYYDEKGDYIGDNYYFNQFPNMVAHNYDELLLLVQKWLYEVSDDDFESYLEKYVKGEIDEYLDQKAIYRLHTIIYGDG